MQKVQIPVPWDKTYQKYFYRAFSEISKRYKEDNQLIAIAMTIACYMGPEWHLPKTEEDRVQWKKIRSKLYGKDQRDLVRSHRSICRIISQSTTLPGSFRRSSWKAQGRQRNHRLWSYKISKSIYHSNRSAPWTA